MATAGLWGAPAPRGEATETCKPRSSRDAEAQLLGTSACYAPTLRHFARRLIARTIVGSRSVVWIWCGRRWGRWCAGSGGSDSSTGYHATYDRRSHPSIARTPHIPRMPAHARVAVPGGILNLGYRGLCDCLRRSPNGRQNHSTRRLCASGPGKQACAHGESREHQSLHTLSP